MPSIFLAVIPVYDAFSTYRKLLLGKRLLVKRNEPRDLNE